MAPFDIFVIDFNGQIVEVNQVACDNLGYTHEEFIKMHARDIKSVRFKEKESNVTFVFKIRVCIRNRWVQR